MFRQLVSQKRVLCYDNLNRIMAEDCRVYVDMFLEICKLNEVRKNLSLTGSDALLRSKIIVAAKNII